MITEVLLASILAALAYLVAFMEFRFVPENKHKSPNWFTGFLALWLIVFLMGGFAITKGLDWLLT